MRIYNVLGFSILAMQLLISALLAPPWLGPYWGMAVGFAYLLASWFSGGVYLSDIIHLGIAHRALDYKDWFVKTVDGGEQRLLRLRRSGELGESAPLHHKFADHAGDPNKLSSDGFWRTLYLCLFPYPCTDDMANDAILKTWPFRLVSHPLFIVVSPILSCGLLWLFVRDWAFAIGVWLGVRVFALWVNMVQNYWTHDRRWGSRRYDVATDNAMNIGDWLPVMATFSACWQNNHHRYPHLLRTTHDDAEFDFGYSDRSRDECVGASEGFENRNAQTHRSGAGGGHAVAAVFWRLSFCRLNGAINCAKNPAGIVRPSKPYRSGHASFGR